MSSLSILNDKARQNLNNYSLSQAVQGLNEESLQQLLEQVKTFNEFSEDNDPWDEHDYGRIEFEGNTYLWKIDYYNKNMTGHSPNSADDSVTRRIICVMRSDEY